GWSPGIVIPICSCHSKPPLLHTYTLPSGPKAAPFGPPPHSPTTVIAPSGVTRESVPRLISTSRTLPSLQPIVPSGNCGPVVTSRMGTSLCRGARSNKHGEMAVYPVAGPAHGNENQGYGSCGRSREECRRMARPARQTWVLLLAMATLGTTAQASVQVFD